MLVLFANGLVVAGGGIMLFSLVPVRRLIEQLPPGAPRIRWYALVALTIGFIVGYLWFFLSSWGHSVASSGIMVPAVFFFGSCFVWLIFGLSVQTVIDMRRLTALELESVTDSLTGLYNRRYVDRRLEEEYSRVRRYDVPLSILLIDIDRFKAVNDTWGHGAGDLLLGDLGRLIRTAVRPSDVAGRYGGDEFVVVAANTPAAAAESLAERLRREIEAGAFGLSGVCTRTAESPPVRVTVSIGVADSEAGADGVNGMIRRVDQALYEAKRQGRNRVVVQDGRREVSLAS